MQWRWVMHFMASEHAPMLTAYVAGFARLAMLVVLGVTHAIALPASAGITVERQLATMDVDALGYGSALDPKTGRMWFLAGADLIAFHDRGNHVSFTRLDSDVDPGNAVLRYDGATDTILLLARGEAQGIDRHGAP